MPRKASGDHTHFERFSAEHPESAKYLITNVPGQLVEIQAMANRGFREIDTQFRVAMTFEHLRSLGRTRAEAIRETGELFELKRSAVSDMVGAEPDDEDLRESSWDVIYTLLQGYLQDEIFAGTYIGAPKGEVTRMEKHASSGAYIHANCLLGRCLRCLVDDTPTGRKKLQARLATFQVQGDREQAFARLIGYSTELRKVSKLQRAQAMADLAALGDNSSLISKYLCARLDADTEIALLRRQIVEIANSERIEDLLNEIVEMAEDIVDQCWETFNDPRAKRRKVDAVYDWEGAYSKYRERRHPEDRWDIGVRNDLENFALAHPGIMRMRVPKAPTETFAQARDREIRQSFLERRAAGEPAEEIIKSLARQHFRSTDRIRRIVYSKK